VRLLLSSVMVVAVVVTYATILYLRYKQTS
jgi:hypothetical protein